MLDINEFLKAINKDKQTSNPPNKADAERLELQKQRLELQKQRLEFEKAKYEQRQAKNTATGGLDCFVYLITTLFSFGTLFVMIFILSKILRY
jgi:hypothetical protein